MFILFDSIYTGHAYQLRFWIELALVLRSLRKLKPLCGVLRWYFGFNCFCWCQLKWVDSMPYINGIVPAEALLLKWRAGSLSISTRWHGKSQVSNLQLHNIRTNFLKSQRSACLWGGLCSDMLLIFCCNLKVQKLMSLVVQAIEVAQVMDEALDTKNTVLVLRCIKIAESHVSSPLQIQYSAFESVTYRFFLLHCGYIPKWSPWEFLF